MKYSTAFIPAFAVASLAASNETRQSELPSDLPSATKKLRWTKAQGGFDDLCPSWGIDEYTCGTELFCELINHKDIKACENPQGWKTAQECLDAHEPKPSRDQCSKQRQATYDQCQKERQEKPEAEKPEVLECITRGNEEYQYCLGYQKFQNTKERLAELRAKGCPV
ncbi:hypothetical protein MY3296_005308 [Beauveria thailandica]